MKSFTMFSKEMILEMIASLPEMYDMSLTETDVEIIIAALTFAYEDEKTEEQEPNNGILHLISLVNEKSDKSLEYHVDLSLDKIEMEILILALSKAWSLMDDDDEEERELSDEIASFFGSVASTLDVEGI